MSFVRDENIGLEKLHGHFLKGFSMKKEKCSKAFASHGLIGQYHCKCYPRVRVVQILGGYENTKE